MSSPRAPWLGLGAIVVLAAALRLPTLGDQSLWFDESATHVVVDGSFGDMVDGINDLEGSPPLFYVLEWIFAKVFGTGETALRLLPALAGIALVPVVFAIGRRLANDRAGLIAALLAATSPVLVWFSQEARNYSLVVLLVALTAALALRFDQTGDRRAYHGTAAVSVLAVATHYFAAFLTVPLAVWLFRHPDRPKGAQGFSLAALPVAGLALLPLALHQADRAKAATVGDFGTRLGQLPKQLLVGYHSPDDTVWTVIAAILVAVALAVGLKKAPRRLLPVLGLAAAAIVPLLLLAAIGSDYLNTRNALAVAAVLAVAVGVALADDTRGLYLAGALATLGVVVVINVFSHQSAQRDDWRGALRPLGAATIPRAIIAGDQSLLPMQVYRPLARLEQGGSTATVKEVDVIALAPRGSGDEPEPPQARNIGLPAGFRLVESKRTRLFTRLRYRSPEFISMQVADLAKRTLDGRAGQVYLEP